MSLFGDEIVASKCCTYCGEEKPLDDFPKHKQHFDGHDSRCRLCIKKRSGVVKQIKKNAPPKPNMCDCCGQEPKSGNGRRKVGLVLDHCPETDTFRGWICVDCNGGLGLLGDNIEGLRRALRYLGDKDA